MYDKSIISLYYKLILNYKLIIYFCVLYQISTPFSIRRLRLAIVSILIAVEEANSIT